MTLNSWRGVKQRNPWDSEVDSTIFALHLQYNTNIILSWREQRNIY